MSSTPPHTLVLLITSSRTRFINSNFKDEQNEQNSSNSRNSR